LKPSTADIEDRSSEILFNYYAIQAPHCGSNPSNIRIRNDGSIFTIELYIL
jgi:hypothetical protein